jgi:hypothetical protein
MSWYLKQQNHKIKYVYLRLSTKILFPNTKYQDT